jgi:hypothetical protein
MDDVTDFTNETAADALTRKGFSADVTANDGERAVTAVISTATIDRDGEVIQSHGINTRAFEANPVVFFGHDYSRPPIGKVVGFKRADTSLTAKIVFAERPKDFPENEEWMPSTLFSLYQQGVMRAFSIGFIPTEVREPTPRDKGTYGPDVKRVFSKIQMLELSAVPIPANSEAVAVAVSKGIVTAATAKALFGEVPAPEIPVNEAPHPEGADGAQLVEVKAEQTDDDAYKVTATYEIPAEPAPVIVPKKLIYYVDPAPAAPAPRVDKAAHEAVSKARGRVYLI